MFRFVVYFQYLVVEKYYRLIIPQNFIVCDYAFGLLVSAFVWLYKKFSLDSSEICHTSRRCSLLEVINFWALLLLGKKLSFC